MDIPTAQPPRSELPSTAEIEAISPLSESQQAIWLMHVLAPESGVYNGHFSARVHAPLKLDLLREAVDLMSARHEMLRTTFAEIDGSPAQIVHAALSAPIIVRALDEHTLEGVIREETQRPFNLERDPLWRIVVHVSEGDGWVLQLVDHHIGIDLVGKYTLLEELCSAYSALLAGQEADFPPLPRTYRDYTAWHRALLEGPESEQMKSYWQGRLGGELPVLDLPLDHSRPAVPRLEGDSRAFRLPANAPAKLRALAKAHNASPLMVLIALFQVLLHRYSGQDEVVIGTPNPGRRGSADWQPIVGNFINMLPVRAKMEGSASFSDLLREVRDTIVEGREHQEFPFRRMVEGLDLDRGSHSPVFQAMLSLQRAPGALEGLSAFVVRTNRPVSLRVGNIELEPLGLSQQEGQLDLSLEIAEIEGEYYAELKYATALFERDTIEAMTEAYSALVDGVLADPRATLAELPLLTEAGRERANTAAQGPARDLDSTPDLLARFLAVVDRSPETTALRQGDRRLSYAELELRSATLAAELRRRGVGKDTVVALYMDRSIELIISILGVLRAGGAFLALDPSQPQARVATLLEQSSAAGVIVSEPQAEALVELCHRRPDRGPWICGLEDVLEHPRGEDEALPTPALGDLAYLVFTSGSTGTPKGAMIEHRGMLNHLLAKIEALGLREGDIIGQNAPQSFVIANWQFLAGLLVGATVDVIESEVARDPAALIERVRQHEVSVLQLVPSLLRLMLDDLDELDSRAQDTGGAPSLRWIVPTGEALAPDLCRRWLSRFPAIPLLNAFGCSEASDDVSHAVIAAAPAELSPRVALGQPAPGITLRVLDSRHQPVPDGMPGELWIAGLGVARGYLGEAERTRERFVELQGQRHYRTGDRVRRRGDGRLEFLGRVDQQVKVRGVRVELGEIEVALRAHPQVRDAAVVALHDDGLTRLVAHIVGEPGAALREFLGARLPDAMVPGHFVFHDALPLNANGKVDRRRLSAHLPAQALPRKEREKSSGEASSELELALAELWSELLDRPEVQVDDDFFALGGHSLLAARMVVRIRNRFDASLPLGALFQHSTVAALARAITEAGGGIRSDLAASEALEAAREDEAATLAHDAAGAHEPFALTDLQQAYWLGQSDTLSTGGLAAIAFLEREVEALDLPRFEAALNQVIARHPMLRTIIRRDGLQQVLPKAPPYRVEHIDLRGRGQAEVEASLARVRDELSSRGIKAEHWPTIQIRVHQLDDHSMIHLGFPLLLGDLQSGRTFFAELDALYDDPDAVLEPVEIHFRDYVEHLRRQRETPEFQSAHEYWQQRLPTLPGAPALPRALRESSIAPSGPAFTRHQAVLPKPAWERLAERARAAGLTPTGLVAAAYSEAIAAFSETPHFGLNLLHQNRPAAHPQISQVIGNFSTTVLLEVDFRERRSFEERARQLQAQLWRDLEHTQVSGVEVIRELARQRGTSTGASMPVVLASTLHLSAEEIEADTIMGTVVTNRLQTPHVWIDHQVHQTFAGLAFHWDVRNDVLPEGVAEAMFACYRGLLETLAEDRGWDRANPIELSPAQGEARAAANASDTTIVERMLHEPFLAQAKAAPERLAVVQGERRLSYGELLTRVSALAGELRERGVERGQRVAVSMRKGWQQIVAVLAIHAAGGAYIPVDPALPRERRQFIVDHAEIAIVLTQEELVSSVEWPSGVERLTVDERAKSSIEARPLPSNSSQPDDLAYVIFTSGSTGTPKGVMIDHRGALNTIVDINERLALRPADRVLALSSLSFDLSVYDLFAPLAVGAAIVLPEAAKIRDPAHWAGLIKAQGVTIWNSVPQLMQLLVDHGEELGGSALASLRAALLSGDWIPLSLPDRLRSWAPKCEVFSLGGATEASIWSIIHPIGSVDPLWQSVPYGKPLHNQRFHVLGHSLEPRPTWVTGELYIAGAGLAQGYLGNPEETAARFIVHPRTGERLYRTGDLGRYMPDGSIEFLGRADLQVKISGFRVELGEIEATLARCPGVGACVLTAHGPAQGARRLVAYVTPAAGRAEELDVETLRSQLAEVLPDYMVPSQILLLEQLPLTANGKLDRQSLPSPDKTSSQRPARIGPRTPLEHQLVPLWREVLELDESDPLGVDDDFFTDLGGHSFAAVRLLARVHAQTGVELALSSLLEGPTIAAQAKRLETATSGAGQPLWSPLVPLREGQDPALRPFFLVHPVGGNVLCYRELVAHLDPQRSVYGLQAYGFTSDQAPLRTIPEMAAHYIEALQTAQPEGPYVLGGWSMGGLVAQEMARQLEISGDRVELLAMIDGARPSSGRRSHNDEAELLAWFMRDLAATGGHSFVLGSSEGRDMQDMQDMQNMQNMQNMTLGVALKEAQRAGVVSAELKVEELRRLFRVFVSNSAAMQIHRPGPVRANTLLLDAVEGHAGDLGGSWGLWVGEHGQRTLPGDHYSILSAHAATLAEQLDHSLRSADHRDRFAKVS